MPSLVDCIASSSLSYAVRAGGAWPTGASAAAPQRCNLAAHSLTTSLSSAILCSRLSKSPRKAPPSPPEALQLLTFARMASRSALSATCGLVCAGGGCTAAAAGGLLARCCPLGPDAAPTGCDGVGRHELAAAAAPPKAKGWPGFAATAAAGAVESWGNAAHAGGLVAAAGEATTPGKVSGMAAPPGSVHDGFGAVVAGAGAAGASAGTVGTADAGGAAGFDVDVGMPLSSARTFAKCGFRSAPAFPILISAFSLASRLLLVFAVRSAPASNRRATHSSQPSDAA